jgi:hypothetical protein
MVLRILRSVDNIQVRNVKVLIYGEPGVGKTSLGFTSNMCLCLDFDKGSHRGQRVGDVLEVNSFGDALELVNSEEGRGILSNYHSIMVDTAGTLLNYMTLYIRDHEQSVFGASRVGSYYDRRRNSLTLQGYGVLKQCFKNFTDSLMGLRKDLIFIAHESVEKNGEELKKIPAIMGGSYDILVSGMDFIGYMSMQGSDRVLDFSPSDSHYGKDSGRLGRVVVPSIPPAIDFLGGLLSRGKVSMGKASAEVLELGRLVGEYKDLISGCEDLEGLNKLLERLKLESNVSVQSVGKSLLLSRSSELGFKFDKDSGLFVVG